MFITCNGRHEGFEQKVALYFLELYPCTPSVPALRDHFFFELMPIQTDLSSPNQPFHVNFGYIRA